MVWGAREDDASGEADGEVDKWKTDDEPEPTAPIVEADAWNKISEDFSLVVNETRAMYDPRSPILRKRVGEARAGSCGRCG